MIYRGKLWEKLNKKKVGVLCGFRRTRVCARARLTTNCTRLELEGGCKTITWITHYYEYLFQLELCLIEVLR